MKTADTHRANMKETPGINTAQLLKAALGKPAAHPMMQRVRSDGEATMHNLVGSASCLGRHHEGREARVEARVKVRDPGAGGLSSRASEPFGCDDITFLHRQPGILDRNICGPRRRRQVRNPRKWSLQIERVPAGAYTLA